MQSLLKNDTFCLIIVGKNLNLNAQNSSYS
jgi:hypothetical protein